MDATRKPQDKAMFTGLAAFKDALADAIGFCETLPKGAATPIAHTEQRQLQDVTFQGNILVFYTRGEAEKLNTAHLLDDEKNSELSGVCDKMNSAIMLAHNALANDAANKSTAAEISQYYGTAAADLRKIADAIGLYGNPLRFLATEIKALSARASVVF
jgi:hypothetical protein